VLEGIGWKQSIKTEIVHLFIIVCICHRITALLMYILMWINTV